jgi:peptidoglycan/xylan/chitin deacetylase (PgdA/CDA1 family)
VVAAAGLQRIPILMYHAVDAQSSVSFRRFVVRPDRFEAHLSWLAEQGHRAVTVRQLAAAMAGEPGAELPERAVVLTFDDAYRDFLVHALPALQRHGFPATLFVPTSFVGATAQWLQGLGEGDRPLLDWEELAEVRDAGIEVGGHGHGHLPLDTVPRAMARADIARCRDELSLRLGIDRPTFAYPFGYDDPAVRLMVAEEGFSAACAIRYAAARGDDDRFSLPRVEVHAGTTVDHLAGLVSGDRTFEVSYMQARSAIWRAGRRRVATVGRDRAQTPQTAHPTDGQQSSVVAERVAARADVPAAIDDDRVGPTVSVVVCTHDEARWDFLMACLASLREQTLPALETVLVVDSNPSLLTRASTLPVDVVVPNAGPRGLSGARNTGIARSSGELIAFLDDDATAAPDWLARLVAAFDDERVLGAGGAVDPWWEEARPVWFPEEFDWVVGCSYRGLPTSRAVVRNVFGGCFCVRRSVIEAVGGFRHDLGRVGNQAAGAEETELCIRATRHDPDGVFVYEPRSRISHWTPVERTTLRYFLKRCWREGRSKAQVAGYTGGSAALSTERTYATTVLPAGVVRGVADGVRARDPRVPTRSAAILAGLATTVLGYGSGRIARLARTQPPLSSPPGRTDVASARIEG